MITSEDVDPDAIVCVDRPGRVGGYAWVSTAGQSADHQVDALPQAGVARENIHVDVASGARARTRNSLIDHVIDHQRRQSREQHRDQITAAPASACRTRHTVRTRHATVFVPEPKD